MKSKTVLLRISLVLLFSFNKNNIQTQQPFPKWSCVTLSGNTFVIPDSIKNGKYTIIGLAFSKKAEQNLSTWFTPTYQYFIQKRKTLFAEEAYDVNTYFVGVISGANKALADEAIKQLKANTPVELQPHVLTYVGEFSSYKKTLGISNADDPYIYVLNEKNVIVYQTSGPYTSTKMEGITNALE
ncbi:MAG: hypothetical protein MUE33_10160 [Cytophagaceae bacterium]|jgi:hypothetical protein|nr:hypothetical protein [Cytophagaceae bacterium]